MNDKIGSYHVVELTPGRGAQLGRSAGAQIQYAGRDQGYTQLVLPSGEMRLVPEDCRATIGQVANLDWDSVTGGKAGRTRWRGRKPNYNPVEEQRTLTKAEVAALQAVWNAERDPHWRVDSGKGEIVSAGAGLRS